MAAQCCEEVIFGTTSRMQPCCRNLSFPILFLPFEGQAYSLPAPPSFLTIAEEWCRGSGRGGEGAY